MRKTVDLAWLAGLFEGEGTMLLAQGRYPKLELTMVDLDVMERVQRVAGFGTVRSRALKSGKVGHKWCASSPTQAIGLAMTLYPFFGERRRARVQELVAAYSAVPLPKGRWTTCKRGHPLTPENTVGKSEGRRRCRTCHNERMRSYRLAKEARP